MKGYNFLKSMKIGINNGNSDCQGDFGDKKVYEELKSDPIWLDKLDS